MRRIVHWLALGMLLLLAAACGRAGTPSPVLPTPTRVVATATLTPSPTATATPRPTATFAPAASPSPSPTYAPLRFAVIGDYGQAGPGQEAVARIVKAWNPDIIVTTGDNNYPNGSKRTIEKNLAVYMDYIEARRFFPTMGNHDWGYRRSPKNLAYLEFFDYLPGNRRYYDVVFGPVHFFMLDSDWREPDGVRADSKQARWLKEGLARSTLPWQIVVFHHAPYSSGMHGDTEYMQWPFAQWGADVVIAGHDHTYERIHRDGIVYIVNGLGGSTRYEFENDTPGSVVRYNQAFGALLAEATAERIHFRFVNVEDQVIDEFVVVHNR